MTSVERITWAELPPQVMNTVLTVAGSDSSGGAGIEADIKAITANGVYALTAITALTAQNTKKVSKVSPTDKDTLREIFNSDFTDIKIDVIKTGLLTPDAVELLSEFIDKYHIGRPLVIDPVLVATSGASLTKSDVLKLLIERLTKKSTLLTPNLIEANEILKLYGIKVEINNTKDFISIAKKVAELTGSKNVLLKGGHIPWLDDTTILKGLSHFTKDCFIIDVLYSSITDSFKIYKSELIRTTNTHGTGCTLASSISANLAKGYSIDESISKAIRYIHSAIISASNITNDKINTNGPLNHFYNIPNSTVHTSGFTEGHFVNYLLSHPTIKPIWDQYINHPFVQKVADGSLRPHKWIRYISQDYPYLISYTKINSIALSVAPDLKSIDRQVQILNEIRHELDQHSERLISRGVTNFESLTFSNAGQAYSDYLFKVAENRDWLEIIVALAPCLIGYYYAALQVKEIKTDNKTYIDWVDTYRSDWYKEAVQLGISNLEKYSIGISYEKTLKLVKIFADICLLEVEFWNDSLHYEE